MWKPGKLLREIWFRWLMLCLSDRVGKKRFMTRMKLLSNLKWSQHCEIWLYVLCRLWDISGLKQCHFHASLGFACETLVFINRCGITNLLPSKFWQVPSIKDPRARPFEHAITHMSACSHLSFGNFLQSRTLGQDPLNMLLLTCQPAHCLNYILFQMLMWLQEQVFCNLSTLPLMCFRGVRGLLMCVISSTLICSRTYESMAPCLCITEMFTEVLLGSCFEWLQCHKYFCSSFYIFCFTSRM
jgi:hypothetical protein